MTLSVSLTADSSPKWRAFGYIKPLIIALTDNSYKRATAGRLYGKRTKAHPQQILIKWS
jgi:hypothetical protein